MVSSGTVSSDAQSLNSLFSRYTSSISNLDSNNVWQGKSKDSITSQAENFVSEYKETIATQMANFANALSYYESYKSAKSAYNNDPDGDNANYYLSQCNEYKSKINSLLSSVKGAKLASATELVESNPGQYELNEFVFYSQGDYHQAYGYSGTIASSGCGPTSMAMVLTYLTGETITPVDTAAYSVQHGYRCEGNGTYEALFPAMAKEYDLNCEQQSYSVDNIVNSLSDGNVIIAHMGPGHFTSGGHYIVLKGLDENGNVIVADPNGGRCNGSWSPQTIVNESKGSMYSISS